MNFLLSSSRHFLLCQYPHIHGRAFPSISDQGDGFLWTLADAGPAGGYLGWGWWRAGRERFHKVLISAWWEVRQLCAA